MHGANLDGIDTSNFDNAQLDAIQDTLELIALPLQVTTPGGAAAGFIYESFHNFGAAAGGQFVNGALHSLPGPLGRGAGVVTTELLKP